MNPIFSFSNFLDNSSMGTVREAQELRDAILEEESTGIYDVTRRGRVLRVVDTVAEVDLILASEKARDAFIELLEDKWGEDLGIDGMVDYQRAMEKD